MAESNFFDIDQILAEQEKVECELLLDGFNLDSLENNYICLNANFEENKKKYIKVEDISDCEKTSRIKVKEEEEEIKVYIEEEDKKNNSIEEDKRINSESEIFLKKENSILNDTEKNFKDDDKSNNSKNLKKTPQNQNNKNISEKKKIKNSNGKKNNYNLQKNIKKENDEISDSEKEDNEPNNLELTNSMLLGTKFKIPLWLAIKLHTFNFIHIEIPKYYQLNYLNIIQVDPEIINLKEKNKNFFLLGNILSKKLKKNFINEILKDIFLIRMKKIILIVLFNYEKKLDDRFLNKLTNLENDFFIYIRKCFYEYNIWKIGKTLVDKNYKVLYNRKKFKKR